MLFVYHICFLPCSGHANKVEDGLKAINQLLKKAKFLHNFAYGESVYLKMGGYQQALMDFERVVDPKTVKTLSIVRNVYFFRQSLSVIPLIVPVYLWHRF